MAYFILGVLIILWIFYVFSTKKNQAKDNNDQSTKGLQDTTRTRTAKLDENPYEGLKRLAYSMH